MNNQSSNRSDLNLPFDEWMLTAWILGELDDVDSNRIETWVAEHPESANEIASLRQTLQSVQSSMSLPSVTLRDSQVAAVHNAIEQAFPSSHPLDAALQPNHGSLVNESNEPPAIRLANHSGKGAPWYRRRAFVAACVAAACVPVAFLARPSLLQDFGVSGNVSSDSARLSQAADESINRSEANVNKERDHTNSSTSDKAESSGAESASMGLSVEKSPAGDVPPAAMASGSVSKNLATEATEAVSRATLENNEDLLAASNDLSEIAAPSAGAPTASDVLMLDMEATRLSSAESKNELVGNIEGELPTRSESSAAQPLLKSALPVGQPGYLGTTASAGGAGGGGGGPIPAGPGGTNYLGTKSSGEYGMTGDATVGVATGKDGIESQKEESRARNRNPSNSDLGSDEFRGLQPSSKEPRMAAGLDAKSAPDWFASEFDGGMAAGGGFGGIGLGNSQFAEESLRLKRQLPDELKANLKMQPLPEIHNSDRFDAIVENVFTDANSEPVTTFSIDVDTASYSKVRQTIQQRGTLPSPNMVRIEELINYFEYEYPSPTDDAPFSAHLKIVPCPWNREHKLVRVGIQAKKLQTENRPRCNLVFLIDVSGSMNEPNKLPLVQRSLSMLASRIRNDDRVAIVVYAGAAGCVLESTPGSEREKILHAINNLQAGGSTNGGQGIQLAYSIAKEQFVPGGANRVVLCTDGDFNVGVTDTNQLVEMMKENAKSNIYLTCLGYGAGNYNDSLMEKISRDGNGLYGMVDNDREAKKLMVEQMMGTLITVAKDVKVQMDFNPELVRSYRLIGYEDRHLANADFANDMKDAGDIGAGHSVTAFYEIVPSTLREPNLAPKGSESKYRKPATPSATPLSDPVQNAEWLTLKIRAKQPAGSESRLQEFVLPYRANDDMTVDSERDLQWASAVAEFGLLLRRSKMAPQASWDSVLLRAAKSSEGNEHRMECLEMMRTARNLAQQQLGEPTPGAK